MSKQNEQHSLVAYYLHSSPVIGQEGHSISKIAVMLGPHAIASVLSFVASSYVVTCHILEVPKHRNLYIENKKGIVMINPKKLEEQEKKMKKSELL